MSRSRLLALLLVCLALPFTIAACGDDDDDGGGGSDEDQIAEAIEESATSTEAADCSKYQTENFASQVEITFGDETGLESCEEDAEETAGDPDSVDTADVAVDGETATASATFNGGGFDGTVFSVSLVKEGDQWKVDSLDDLTGINLEAFQAALDESLAADPEVPPEAAQCVSEQVATLTEDQIYDVLVNGNDQVFVDAVGPCG